MIKYEEMLVQVEEVLKYLDAEELKKIPNELRDKITKEKSKDYVWKYDITKKLEEQSIDRDTIAFLSFLNMKYLLSTEQRELMEKIHWLNEIKLEMNKGKKYNPDSIFKKR